MARQLKSVDNNNIHLNNIQNIVFADKEVLYWVRQNNWGDAKGSYFFINNQEGTVKTRNITENIEFDSVASIMAHCK